MEKRKSVHRAAIQGFVGIAGIGMAFLIAAIPSHGIDDLSLPIGRDSARISTLYRVDAALDAYVSRYGKPPPHQPDSRFGGWETSLDGSFLKELVDKGLLVTLPLDPLNDDQFHFRYCVYPPGSWGDNKEPFFVLAATGLEKVGNLLADRNVYSRGGRTWSDEFPFTLGSP